MLIGDPSEAVATELSALWKKEWRPQGSRRRFGINSCHKQSEAT